MSGSAKADEARKEALRKDIDFTEQGMEEKDILAKYLDVTLEKGLTMQQVMEQRQRHGENRLTPPKKTHWFIKYLLEFTNFFALLLMFGGVLCFVGFSIDETGDPTNLYLGVVLELVTFLTCTFSYIQNAKSEAIMEGFKKMIPEQCDVIREGQVSTLDAWELVPGDIVKMKEGQKVPADIRLLRSNEVKVDNASLTGESEPQERTADIRCNPDGTPVTALESENLCFYTTMIVTGSCTGIVIGTADHTIMGQIAGLATETSGEQTPIAKEIEKFIHIISAIAIFLGVLFFALSLALYGTEPEAIIGSVVFMIGIIVANVPEGLLATVTVSLALTAQRMHQKYVLVKNLEAVETLGSTSVIASDKTGTLTQNRMTVQHCWYDEKVFATPAAKNSIMLAEQLAGKEIYGEPVYNPEDATFKKLQMVTTLCNNADFLTMLPKDDETSTYVAMGCGTVSAAEGAENVVIDVAEGCKKPAFNLLKLNCSGDASESGLLKYMQPISDATAFRAKYPKVFEIKFNSTNKWQLSIHQQPDSERLVIVLKGAPERVLKKCKFYMKDGEKVSVTPEWEKGCYTKAYESLGGLGERVLGFAFAELPESFTKDFNFTQKPEPNFPMDDLVFVGLNALIDPPREGVPEAVDKCKRARIRVFMVTGDHPITAQAIARKVGIIDAEVYDAGNAMIVSGDMIRDWEEISDPAIKQKKWDDALDHQQLVFARVSPAHKLLIVEHNQRRGEIVAVTGDGVNDAPALRKADIGIAMGIAGMDVSKEAADMILMNDNFASIVNGVEEGRLIFDNLKKSIAYTLSSNIPEIGPFLLYITIQLPLPLSTVMILMVDLGTDMVPAISLAYELKEADIMDRPPRNAATESLVNRKLICFAYFQIGVIQALAGFFTYFIVLNDYGFNPKILPGLGGVNTWQQYSVICKQDTDLKAQHCGYGCEDPAWEDYYDKVLHMPYKATDDIKEEYCKGGCKIPFATSATGSEGLTNPFSSNTTGLQIAETSISKDPFIEFTTEGFRGFDCPDVCSRSCSWYDDINFGVAENRKGKSYKYSTSHTREQRFDLYCITSEDEVLFNEYCYGHPENNTEVTETWDCSAEDNCDWGFNGFDTGKTGGKQFARKPVDDEAMSMGYGSDCGTDSCDDGGDLDKAFYWWDGKQQFYPNVKYQKEALGFAQTAYFICIIVVQWADLLICKTRKLSIFDQGMANGFMNFGLCFETILGMFLIYTPPLNDIFGTRPLHILHWFPGLPWSMFIFFYDEVRKSIMRKNPKGWLDNFTYW